MCETPATSKPLKKGWTMISTNSAWVACQAALGEEAPCSKVGEGLFRQALGLHAEGEVGDWHGARRRRPDAGGLLCLWASGRPGEAACCEPASGSAAMTGAARQPAGTDARKTARRGG